MAIENTPTLTPEQHTHFLEHGWVKIPQAIPKEHVDLYTKDLWVRLGYDKNDPSTWEEETFRMPRHREMPWSQFAPKGYAAICEVVGGEDRLDSTLFSKAGDNLIANFGKEEYRDKAVHPRDLGVWHVDGNWFTHFLDSSEQPVLCILLFNDIVPRGGGTFLCEDGLTRIIQWLHERPQGVDRKLVNPDGTSIFDELPTWEKFVECTGNAGDMYICHGFMPHSVSKNHLRIPRFITSPKIVLKEPFKLNREDPKDYSLAEKKILHDLGVSSLPDWKIIGERTHFVAANIKTRDARVPLEVERLKAHAAKTGGVAESIHIHGVVAPEAYGFKA
ncbi:hypothetical protein BDZ94DRAFT_1316130 [Collybia nuda]|uniref:Uncharacterized protein n=1 Tax=Collybia nuda TaxID=64659 RepID=A0A9P5XU65_9AGAR|nr:hypothetical protein BDZ94DRAFT_1316130 [Collybia nuda]